jgi:putative ABC transport system ATP-binding protein
MSESIVELDEVHRTYSGQVAAVRGVSLTVERGELVAIVGASGSGKTTLLNLMGTLDRPDEGTVRIGGHDVSALSDRELSWLRAKRIGFVFQQFHLLPAVPIIDAVADGLLYAGVARRQRQAQAVQMLRRLGLGHRLDHPPGKLSGGEQQRVAVARACVGNPDLLLADEPTGNLDSTSGQHLIDLLLDLSTTGTAVVVITHNEELAAGLPRRIDVRDGRVVADHRLTTGGDGDDQI